MNKSTIETINNIVFMKRLELFEKPDVIVYHPGHFPELNEQLVAYYKANGAEMIMIPGVYNRFLDCNEYEYYAPLLKEAGVEKEKIVKIPTTDETKGVGDVINSAFSILNQTNQKNILLAGKGFFSRRFYLLASTFANTDKVIDVLPLQDHRGIEPTKWTESEKGRARVLNEIEQFARISKELLSNK